MMPAYNAGRYIASAIRSLLDQTYPHWELILVDDGSTDDTAQVAARFDDPRIRFFHQPNGGEAAARNRCLQEMSGAYLAFLDADDQYLPDHLAVAVSALQTHPEWGGVYTDGIYIDENDTRLQPLSSRRRGPFSGDIFEQMVRASDVMGAPLCTLLRTSLIRWQRLTFDPAIVIGPDWDFLVQFSETAWFGALPQQTCLYRVHTANLTHSTASEKRSNSLARCREKAIRMRRFHECSLETREFVFYDLLVNWLVGQPQRQQEAMLLMQFLELPQETQSRLLRHTAVQAIRSGQAPGELVKDWLSRSLALSPSDRRTRMLFRLYRLHPTVCRLALAAK